MRTGVSLFRTSDVLNTNLNSSVTSNVTTSSNLFSNQAELDSVDPTGFEPVSSSLQMKRSTNWTTGPMFSKCCNFLHRDLFCGQNHTRLYEKCEQGPSILLLLPTFVKNNRTVEYLPNMFWLVADPEKQEVFPTVLSNDYENRSHVETFYNIMTQSQRVI